MKKQTKKDEVPDDVSALRGWRRARSRGGSTRLKPPSRRITINIDADVIAIFQAEALRGGLPYQVAINQALRDYLHNKEHADAERAAELVLKALDDEAVIAKIRHLH